jgi:hypothetical protein
MMRVTTLSNTCAVPFIHQPMNFSTSARSDVRLSTRPDVAGSRPALTQFRRSAQRIAADPYPDRFAAPRQYGRLASPARSSHPYHSNVLGGVVVRRVGQYDAVRSRYVDTAVVMPAAPQSNREVASSRYDPSDIAGAAPSGVYSRLGARLARAKSPTYSRRDVSPARTHGPLRGSLHGAGLQSTTTTPRRTGRALSPSTTIFRDASSSRVLPPPPSGRAASAAQSPLRAVTPTRSNLSCGDIDGASPRSAYDRLCDRRRRASPGRSDSSLVSPQRYKPTQATVAGGALPGWW